MVGEKIPARFLTGLWRDAKVLCLSHASQIVLEVCSTAADQFDIARPGQNDVRVEVDYRRSRRERVLRMTGVIFRAKKTFLLRRPQGKNHRARRRLAGLEGTRDLQYFRCPGGVINCAVADVISPSVR